MPRTGSALKHLAFHNPHKLVLRNAFVKTAMKAGFDLKAGDSPIVPVMLYNAQLAQDFARDMLDEGIYVIGFFYPVVPKGQSRIRVQISAAHTTEHLDKAVAAFKKIGKKLGVI